MTAAVLDRPTATPLLATALDEYARALRVIAEFERLEGAGAIVAIGLEHASAQRDAAARRIAAALMSGETPAA